jgi:hypothetical protein
MSSNINNIFKNLREIQKRIEKNDPNEELSWLNDVYGLVEDTIDEVGFLENNIQNVIDSIEDLK